MSPTRAALEAALAADPDDPARHAAYADLLIEEGDPRGEFVRLQLALEDRDQPADRLHAMQQGADELVRRHAAEWLGPLAPFVADDRRGAGPAVGLDWRRGWIDLIEVEALTDPLRAAVAEEPLARLLRELVIRANGVSMSPRGAANLRIRYTGLGPLAKSPNVRNLRRLELGTEADWHLASFDADIGELVKQTPRLEHLSIIGETFIPARVFAATLPHLHTLEVTTNNHRLPVAILVYNGSLGNLRRLHLDIVRFLSDDPMEVRNEREPVYPDELMTLFRSEHLRSLEDLSLRLPGFGDVGVDELIGSGLLGRLRSLDLSRCDITDDGAVQLAGCPDVPQLKSLSLDGNLLSAIGVEALAGVGVRVGRQFWDAGGEADYV